VHWKPKAFTVDQEGEKGSLQKKPWEGEKSLFWLRTVALGLKTKVIMASKRNRAQVDDHTRRTLKRKKRGKKILAKPICDQKGWIKEGRGPGHNVYKQIIQPFAAG